MSLPLVYPFDFEASLSHDPYPGMSAIYGLCEPNGELRYIGKTDKPRLRYASHCCSPTTKKDEKCYVVSWIKHLQGLGCKPVMRVLLWVPQSEWPNAERVYIAEGKRRGYRLINLHPGGDSAVGYKARRIARIAMSKAQRDWMQRDPEGVARRNEAVRQTYIDHPEKREAKSRQLKAIYADPAMREMARQRMLDIAQREGYWDRVRAGVARAYSDPEYRQRHADAVRAGVARRDQRRAELIAQGVELAPLFPVSAESNAKRSASLKATMSTPEFRAKRSEISKRVVRTQEWKDSISRGNKGREVTDERRVQISEQLKVYNATRRANLAAEQARITAQVEREGFAQLTLFDISAPHKKQNHVRSTPESRRAERERAKARKAAQKTAE